MPNFRDKRSNRQVIKTARQIQKDLLKCAAYNDVLIWNWVPWPEGFRPNQNWEYHGFELPFNQARIVPLDFYMIASVNNYNNNTFAQTPFGYYKYYTNVHCNLKYNIVGYQPNTAWNGPVDNTPLRGGAVFYIVGIRKKYAWALSACCYNENYLGLSNSVNYGFFRPEVQLQYLMGCEMFKDVYVQSVENGINYMNITGPITAYAYNQSRLPRWFTKYYKIYKKYNQPCSVHQPDIKFKIPVNWRKFGCAYQNITATIPFNANSQFNTSTGNNNTVVINGLWTYDMHLEKRLFLVCWPYGLSYRQVPTNNSATFDEQYEEISMRMTLQHYFMIPPNQSLLAWNSTSSTIANLVSINDYDNNGTYWFGFSLVANSTAIKTAADGSTTKTVTIPIPLWRPYITTAPSWITAQQNASIFSTFTANAITDDSTSTLSRTVEETVVDAITADSTDDSSGAEPEQTTKTLVSNLLKKVGI